MSISRIAWGVSALSLLALVASGCGGDGESATVTAEPAGANCANGGVKVQVGAGTPTYVCNGAKGADGATGQGAIITAEPAGANCASGGVKVQVGTATPNYVCNGAKGSDGTVGQSASVTPEPAGANCANGGLKVQVGTAAAAYACNGPKGADGSVGQSATVTPEPQGANCAAGGVKVQVGTGAATYICNAAALKYYVFVRGHFTSSDMAANKTAHDKIVTDNRANVTGAGDEKHLALLGLQDPQSFLAIDVWNSLDGLNAFLGNPAVQQAFGALFDPQSLSFTIANAPQGFLDWGTLAPKPSSWVVSVRGDFKGTTLNANQAAHNQVAGGGESAANSLGDYGHLAFLDMTDSTNFQAIDEWDNLAGMNTFLSDPNVQAAFGSLFSGQPTIDVYTTSDLAQY
jgi:quinol monooxygenase YgiN